MYIHDKKEQKQIILEECLCLLPLFLYGIYKNGYLLYTKDLISLTSIFYPLLYLVVSFVIYFITKLIVRHKFVLEYDIIHLIIVSMIIMPNLNIYTFTGCLFILNLINELILKKVHFNRIAFYKLAIVGIVILLKNYEYRNLMEINYKFSYNYFDLLFGHQIGGWASTNIILALVIFLILSYRQDVKSKVATSSIFTYLIVSLGFCLFKHQFIFGDVLNANVFFALLLVAPEDMSSPTSAKGMLLYGITTGILTFILSYKINYFEGVYIAILINSLFLNLYEKIANWRIFCKKC